MQSGEGGLVLWGCLLCAVTAIALVIVADRLIGRVRQVKPDTAPDGTTGGHMLNLIRAVFLLSFAIGLIVPWTTSDRARQNTYAEAQSLVEAYWQANRLPVAEGATVHAQLQAYTRFVINTEWPELSEGHLDQQGWTMLDSLRGNLMSKNYPEKYYADADNAVLSQLSNVYAARRQRAVDADGSLPVDIIVFAILTGGIVIFYPFLVAIRPRGRAMVPLVITAGLIGAGLYLMVSNNHVFSGGIAVKPTAFQSALLEMQRITS